VDCSPQVMLSCLFFFFSFFVVLGFELSFMLARQVLYCLSYVSNPFCSGYFGDKSLIFCPGWPGLRSFSFMFPAVAGMTAMCPAFSVEVS
jgi:hypothetical protein